jgi:hypothetical protein
MGPVAQGVFKTGAVENTLQTAPRLRTCLLGSLPSRMAEGET